MASGQVRKFAKSLRRLRREHDTLADAKVAFCQEFEEMLGDALTPTHLERIEEACELVRREEEDEVEILRKSSMYAQRPTWYHGPRIDDLHWPLLSAYLVNSKEWTEENVNEKIGKASTEIVSLLGNPGEDQFACKGLVIGYVQSGKTANMTAVIAKAIDAGYNFVIVLAGLTNKLRQQTQRRLEADVAERYRTLWDLKTTDKESGDFRRLANGGFFVPPAPAVQMAVVKKNVAPLKRLIETINKTSPVALRSMKVLIIDDEADQASVNSASNELDMTRINELVRTLLRKLPAYSYVGYTATPFANVFISPYGQNGDLDDLYPKDFITALETPDGYFGAEKLFGLDPVDPASPTPQEEGLDVIRVVPDAEAALLQPRRRDEKDAFQPLLVSSLEKAVLYFLCCCAARRARGQTEKHMSMLVHTSSFVVMHEKLAGLIEGWLAVNRAGLLTPGSAVNGKLREVWNEESGRLPDDITSFERQEFDEIEPYLADVFKHLKVPVENGVSEDRIDYEGGPRTYIVVGGSVLARGLTIEGLMVSYFLRSSSQYDTLLQMGRWFGYRGGYEDLPRIWMTSELEDSFRSLATIEQEIRLDVQQYAERKVSPTEFAVRVRSIPGMAITAAAKMRHAVECDISYSGQHVQTIQFNHLDKDVADRNWQAATDLLSTAQSLGLKTADDDRILFRGVPRNLIVQFLRKFHIETTRNDLKTDFLRGYINGDAEDLAEWNVGVITSGANSPSEKDLGMLGKVGTVRRSRLKQAESERDTGEPANIKALMSRADVMTDCPGLEYDRNARWTDLKKLRRTEAGDVPLLLIYPIERLSAPNVGSKSREALDACADQVGIGIVFPGSSTGAGGYYHVDLNPPATEDLEAMDAELDEMEAMGLVD